MEWVGWRKPPLGWMKLNIDGSLSEGLKKARGGGLVRDYKGQWQGGFSIQNFHSTLEEAELWALLHGLKMAWDMGIRKFIVEIDSLKVFSWVNHLEEIENSLSNVI